MVARGKADDRKPREPPANRAPQQNSELTGLKTELAAIRKEIKAFRDKDKQQDELVKTKQQLEKARQQLENLKNPPPPPPPKPAQPPPTEVEVLQSQLAETRKALRKAKDDPDREAAILRRKLLEAEQQLALAKNVSDSSAVTQAKALSAEAAKLSALVLKVQTDFKKRTGIAKIDAIASEIDTIQRELKSVQAALALNRFQVGLIAFAICWVAIIAAEAVHFGRSAWARIQNLPGMGLLSSSESDNESGSGFSIPTTSTPLKVGDRVAGFEVTSGFGHRVPPCNGCSAFHPAVDIATPTGTPLYAPYPGTIECKGGDRDPAGHYLVVRSDANELPDFLLLHLSPDTCKAGKYEAGQKIALSGSSGNGTGPHLDLRQVEGQEQVVPSLEWAERILLGKSPTGDVEFKVDALRRAIIGQESAGNFQAINPDSGALGYGQVMPANLPSWSRAALGREIGRDEFLSSPELQIEIINHKLTEYLNAEIAAGHSEEIAIRRVASRWYSGRGDLYANTRPQYYGRRRYLSISQYTLSILRKYQAEKNG